MHVSMDIEGGKRKIESAQCTLVRRGDRVISIVGTRRAANLVLPPGADAGAGGHLDDGAVEELQVGVAGHAGAVDVLDRVVAVGGAHALELALVLAVDRHPLEDGVAADGGRQGDESEGLHLWSVVVVLGRDAMRGRWLW